MEVVDEVERSLQGLERRDIVAESLSRNGFVALCETLDEAVALVNTFAPEHLEIMTRDRRAVAKQITTAGIILLGEYTPVAASDYCYGTNHVLPTAGSGHVYSELSVFDFVKRVNVVECSREKLQELQNLAHTLALSEGLPNHSRAIEGRLRDDVEVA
jgi:histidinol dehydrogenase